MQMQPSKRCQKLIEKYNGEGKSYLIVINFGFKETVQALLGKCCILLFDFIDSNNNYVLLDMLYDANIKFRFYIDSQQHKERNQCIHTLEVSTKDLPKLIDIYENRLIKAAELAGLYDFTDQCIEIIQKISHFDQSSQNT